MYHKIVNRVPKNIKLKYITNFSTANVHSQIFVEINPGKYSNRDFGDYYHVVDSDLLDYVNAWQYLNIVEIERELDELCNRMFPF